MTGRSSLKDSFLLHYYCHFRHRRRRENLQDKVTATAAAIYGVTTSWRTRKRIFARQHSVRWDCFEAPCLAEKREGKSWTRLWRCAAAPAIQVVTQQHDGGGGGLGLGGGQAVNCGNGCFCKSRFLFPSLPPFLLSFSSLVRVPSFSSNRGGAAVHLKPL